MSQEHAPLPTSRYLSGLYEAVVAFGRHAERAGLSAPVPTCPGWKVRDLVAHQGMVHRWAAATLRGEQVAEPERFEREGRVDADPLEWLRDGAVELAQAITDLPADARVPVFLKEPPEPRTFWARRQCHETTMHAVDALAAALGRPPTPDELWFGEELATDGVDELLVGFLQRDKYRFNTDPASTLVVVATDVERTWTLRLEPEGPVVAARVAMAPDDAEWRLTAPVVELYLQLWNRSGRTDGALPPGWHGATSITW